MRHRWLFATALVVAACGKKSQDCQNEVADLTDWARTIGREPPTIVTNVRLAERPGTTEALEEAAVLEISATGARLDGQTVDVTTVGQRLIDQAMKRSRAAKLSALVAIDADTPWRVVTEYVTAAASTGFNVLGFVFSIPSTVQPPPRTSVDDEIAKLAPTEKVPGLAKVLGGVIAQCKQLEQTFQSLATYRSGDRGDILASGLGHGIHDCQCKVDIPKLRSVLYQVFAATPMRTITVRLQTGAAPLELPADMAWRDASKQLPTTGLTWFTTK